MESRFQNGWNHCKIAATAQLHTVFIPAVAPTTFSYRLDSVLISLLSTFVPLYFTYVAGQGGHCPQSNFLCVHLSVQGNYFISVLTIF